MPDYSRTQLDFTLNTATTAYQKSPALAALKTGGFVTVWATTDATQDGNLGAIKLQLLNSAGEKVGAEILVNTATYSDQYQPSVTVLSNGNFVVTWTTGDTFEDGSGLAVKAQMFTAAGAKVGSEFLVETQTTMNQQKSTITALADGGFVVSWETTDGTQDGYGIAIKAQRYSSTGVKVGSEFLVNTTYGVESNVKLVGLSDGGFMATWTLNSGSSGDVYGRIFDANGNALGTSFLLNTTTTYSQGLAQSVQLSDGTILAIWVSTVNSGGTTQIFGQKFSATGIKIGGEFAMKDWGGLPFSSIGSATVVALADGGYALSWTSNNTQNNLANVYFQQYNADGSAHGMTEQINTSTSMDELNIRSAIDANGSILTVWENLNLSVPADYNVGAALWASHIGPQFTNNYGYSYAGTTTAENQTYAGTLQATNPNGGTLTYSIAGGEDAARFTINASTGVLSFVSAPNYEAPDDQFADRLYLITIRASDGTYSDLVNYTVTLTNVNEAPVFASGTSSFVMAENTAGAIAVFTATDPELAAVTYSLSGADAALFAFDSATRTLSLISPQNFEAPADAGGNNVYNVSIVASDGANSSTQAVTVTITDTNEAPVFTTSNTLSASENATAAGTVAATDPEGTARTYSIVGGADAALFTIDAATGALSFVTAPDYEWPQDADHDNAYQVTVQASDGTLSATQAVTVTVGNADEAPVILFDDIANPVIVGVAEGATAVHQIIAYDPDGAPLSYSISGGADAAFFTIDALTGALSFIAGQDREAPADANGDNIYDVVVTVSDGTMSVNETIGALIMNVNETPTITLPANFAVDEGTSLVTFSAVGGDPDGDPLTYSLSGADAGLFTIDPFTGVVMMVANLDHEAPIDADADNLYELTVTVSDGELSAAQGLTITVNNVNEAPTITSTASFVVVDEGTTAVTTLTGSDPENTALTWSIVGGADAARFTIDALTGALSLITAPDHDAPIDSDGDNIYDVIIGASDGSLIDTQALAVAISDINEAPTITSNGGGASAAIAVAENTTSVTTVTSTDPEGTARTYSIVGGADAARFMINAATGALSFIAPPNYEAASDTGGDNIYDVIVAASDGTLTDTQALAIMVTNANDAPTITSNGGGDTASVTVNENTTAVTTVTSTDPEGTARTYSIVGGSDAARFTINATTGVLSFVAAPNYEAPTDSNGDNVYNVIVQSSDGSLVDTQALAVAIGNVTDGSTITGTNSANTLTGTTAEDTIDGRGGNDTITGGLGADVMTGGAGADRFVFNTLNDSRVNAPDRITDFTLSQNDRIQLSGIDANASLAGDQAFSWIGTGNFTNVAGQLRYYQQNGHTYVTGDVNGDGVGDFLIQLDPAVTLAASYFVL